MEKWTVLGGEVDVGCAVLYRGAAREESRGTSGERQQTQKNRTAKGNKTKKGEKRTLTC